MEYIRSSFTCSRENLTIRGEKFLPKDAAGRLPAVIISHGFMSNHKKVVKYAKRFAGWGYAAYCFDFCGGCLIGKSDGQTTDMSVLTEVEDLKAVLSYVKGQDTVDPGRVLLMGCSQGGLVSALTAAQLPREATALILFYPALCVPDDARRGQMMSAKFDPEHIPDKMRCGFMRLGRVYAESVMKMDPFEEIRGYDGPVLIVHGTKDDVVDPDYARRAYEVYTQGRPQEHPDRRLVFIEGGRHGFSRRHVRTAASAVKRFLEELQEDGF